MDFFSNDSTSVVNPKDMVRAFTYQTEGASGDLSLENLALITFTSQDLHFLVQSPQQARLIGTWKNRNPRMYRGQGWVAVQSPLGASGTVMLLEELVAFGVRCIVLLGYCGTIQKGVFLGDLVLPLEAIREEGTSYHYLPKGEKSLPDLEVQRRLFDCVNPIGVPLHQGPIWTTDAPYRETPEKVRRYEMEGVLAVEMEMAAVFAFGKAAKISAGAVLIVSDEVREKGWRIGFFSPQIRSTRKRVIEAIIHHLPSLVSL
jgi:uridine phosphorylase